MFRNPRDEISEFLSGDILPLVMVADGFNLWGSLDLDRALITIPLRVRSVRAL